jgi:hypothetical protein
MTRFYPMPSPRGTNHTGMYFKDADPSIITDGDFTIWQGPKQSVAMAYDSVDGGHGFDEMPDYDNELNYYKTRAHAYYKELQAHDGKQTRSPGDSHDEKMTLLARKLSEDDWKQFQHVLRGSDDEGVSYHGQKAPARENMQARGGNDPRDPGKMTARGSSFPPGITGSADLAKHIHGQDAKDFYESMGADGPMRVDTTGLAEDRKPGETSRSSVDTFRQMFPEYEPMRNV